MEERSERDNQRDGEDERMWAIWLPVHISTRIGTPPTPPSPPKHDDLGAVFRLDHVMGVLKRKLWLWTVILVLFLVLVLFLLLPPSAAVLRAILSFAVHLAQRTPLLCGGYARTGHGFKGVLPNALCRLHRCCSRRTAFD